MAEGFESCSLVNDDYSFFKQEILKLTGIDLHAYKEKQMKRRINTLIGRKGYDGYEKYIRLLKSTPDELAMFMDYITINVTEFFRTPDHWTYFQEHTLRELSGRKKELKIWSCACSAGEEPYSLVMSLAEYLPLDKIHVLATDLDRKVLQQAEQGIYSEKEMETVPEKMKQKYFTWSGNSWQIDRKIRECVDFRCLDLLRDPYPVRLDLILCRNVLIYFTEEAKDEIYRKLHTCLAEGGYLFTGNTEQIIHYKQFGFLKEKNFIYRK